MVSKLIGQMGMLGRSPEHCRGHGLCRQEAAQPKEPAAAAIDVVSNLAGRNPYLVVVHTDIVAQCVKKVLLDNSGCCFLC
jgi:hypothetical protein